MPLTLFEWVTHDVTIQSVAVAGSWNDWCPMAMQKQQWASSVMLFIAEGWWSKPHRELFRGLVSRKPPKVPYAVVTTSSQA